MHTEAAILYNEYKLMGYSKSINEAKNLIIKAISLNPKSAYKILLNEIDKMLEKK